jgi:hypothetical protein
MKMPLPRFVLFGGARETIGAGKTPTTERQNEPSKTVGGE